MKKIIFKLLIAVLVIPSLVAGAIYWLNRGGFFNLDQVEVAIDEGSRDPQFLQPLLGSLNEDLQKYRGQSLWRLNLPKITSTVQKLNWVEDVSLVRRWPSKLSLRVRAKNVKLLYLSKGGEIFPIVADGSFLAPVSAKTAPDAILLEGPLFENNLEMRKKAVKIISELPSDGKFSQKKVSELRFDAREGFWATLIQSGIRVKIGDENIPLKSARVSQVLEYLETRELEARVIDANLSKKVLVRLRKDP